MDGIETKRRAKLLRATPTESEFQAAVANLCEQPFGDTADDSADLVEFIGLAGPGQVEAWWMQ